MTTKTNERAEVQARLDAITARIQTRTGEISAIEARQLAAATTGEAPDRTLSTALAVLRDEQGVDEKAAAAVRAQLDQLDAAAARERDVARLAQLRRAVAEKAREAEAEGDALATALDAALEALRSSGVDLHGRIAKLGERTKEQDRLASTANALAEALGEPADVAGSVNHLERVFRGLGNDLHRSRVLHAAKRNPSDVVAELGAAAKVTMPRSANRGEII
jgi:chromosome segregation ATPase